MTHASRRAGGTWRRRGAALALATLFAFPACKRAPPVEDHAPPPPPSAKPVDRLAPGELIPGDKNAFGIVLPRDVKVDQVFHDVFFTSGPVNASDLANYVRPLVKDGTVNVGATATVFDQVRPVADPSHLLFVRIYAGPMGRGARMEVRDVTPPPLSSAPSPEERWKQLGLSPQGKILDPKHLQ
jgi:hypothetical protein